MTKIAERYSAARNTSNLKSDPRTLLSASDVLGAAGMASQEHADAMRLWEVAFQGKTSAKIALVESLTKPLTLFMIRRGLSGDPKTVAREMVAWQLHGACPVCGGEGHEVVPNTTVRYDHPCRACDGGGKVAFPRTEAHLWLKTRMEKMQALAASAVMKKLSLEMDL